MDDGNLASLEKVLKEQLANPRWSRADLVYETLRGAIMGGQLAGGARILETDVANLFGVSRTPVREALQRLQERGWLAVETGRGGLIVTEITRHRVLELYAVREVLEGASARFAAENASRSQIATLRGLLEELPPSGGDSATRARINRVFHRTTYEAAHNSYLAKLLADLYDELALVRAPFHNTDPARSHQAHDEHRQIVEAIAAGDGDAAEHAARHHIRCFHQTLVGLLSKTSA